MKKQLFVSALAMAVIATTGSTAFSAGCFQDSLKGIGGQFAQDAKSLGKDLKSSVNADINNTVTANKRAKVAEITNQKNAALQPVDVQIAAKQKEIDAIKSADILETERTLRLSVLTREMKCLQAKRAAIANSYDSKLNAIK